MAEGRLLLTKSAFLVGLADGQEAGLRFREMAFGDADASRKRAIRQGLETYCHQDAEGMLDIVKKLESICR